jgi:uncharacterized protein YlxW (UPF0749 family)
MPIEVMWSILIAMGAITTAAVLKVVEYARKLHLSDKELSSSGEELNTLKQQENKTISDLEKLHLAEKEKLTDRISDLEKQVAFHHSKPLNYPNKHIV